MAVSDKPPANAFVAQARRIYNPIGYSKGYNAILWFILSGALLGFCLARMPSIDIKGTYCNPDVQGINKAAPGECYHYDEQYYSLGMRLHLIGVLPAGVLACIQFLPFIRHRWIIIHRISGYLSIILSFVGVAGAIMIAPISMGGSLDIRAAVGFLAIVFVGSISMAYINIKRLQIEQHRIWMLRAWSYATAIITMRLAFISASMIISGLGFYSSIPCAQIVYTIGEETTRSMYPSCDAYFSGEAPHAHAAVEANMSNARHASEAAAALNICFGMSTWIAFGLHIFLVELYIKLTPAEHERLRQVSYERQRKAGYRNPGRGGLTVDRFGDAERWLPLNQARHGDSKPLTAETEFQSESYLPTNAPALNQGAQQWASSRSQYSTGERT